LERSSTETRGNYTLVVKTLGSTTREEFRVGTSVLDNLNKTHKVRMAVSIVKTIECIDEICIKNDFWWEFKVNNKTVLATPASYYPKDKDKVELLYGDVK
jgi:hypothetical protein